MTEADINPETSEISCPTCKKKNFKVFRKDKHLDGIYLINHCRCENCGQLFVYTLNQKNKVIFNKIIQKDE